MSGVPFVPSQSCQKSGMEPIDPRHAQIRPTGRSGTPLVFSFTRRLRYGGSSAPEAPELPPAAETSAWLVALATVIGWLCVAPETTEPVPAAGARVLLKLPVFALVCAWLVPV
jgi:hypothetical protein